jgi:hypothetical protein
MRPVYARLAALLGLDGTLYAYSDDVYLVSDPDNMSAAFVAAPSIYRKIGLRIGWGPSKTELLPSHCDPEACLHRLDENTKGLSRIITDFIVCLGVPRHVASDPEFIASSLQSLGVRQNRLLDLVEPVAYEDLFAAFRLLQVYGV